MPSYSDSIQLSVNGSRSQQIPIRDSTTQSLSAFEHFLFAEARFLFGDQSIRQSTHKVVDRSTGRQIDSVRNVHGRQFEIVSRRGGGGYESGASGGGSGRYAPTHTSHAQQAHYQQQQPQRYVSNTELSRHDRYTPNAAASTASRYRENSRDRTGAQSSSSGGMNSDRYRTGATSSGSSGGGGGGYSRNMYDPSRGRNRSRTPPPSREEYASRYGSNALGTKRNRSRSRPKTSEPVVGGDRLRYQPMGHQPQHTVQQHVRPLPLGHPQHPVQQQHQAHQAPPLGGYQQQSRVTPLAPPAYSTNQQHAAAATATAHSLPPPSYSSLPANVVALPPVRQQQQDASSRYVKNSDSLAYVRPRTEAMPPPSYSVSSAVQQQATATTVSSRYGTQQGLSRFKQAGGTPSNTNTGVVVQRKIIKQTAVPSHHQSGDGKKKMIVKTTVAVRKSVGGLKHLEQPQGGRPTNNKKPGDGPKKVSQQQQTNSSSTNTASKVLDRRQRGGGEGRFQVRGPGGDIASSSVAANKTLSGNRGNVNVQTRDRGSALLNKNFPSDRERGVAGGGRPQQPQREAKSMDEVFADLERLAQQREKETAEAAAAEAAAAAEEQQQSEVFVPETPKTPQVGTGAAITSHSPDMLSPATLTGFTSQDGAVSSSPLPPGGSTGTSEATGTTPVSIMTTFPTSLAEAVSAQQQQQLSPQQHALKAPSPKHKPVEEADLADVLSEEEISHEIFKCVTNLGGVNVSKRLVLVFVADVHRTQYSAVVDAQAEALRLHKENSGNQRDGQDLDEFLRAGFPRVLRQLRLDDVAESVQYETVVRQLIERVLKQCLLVEGTENNDEASSSSIVQFLTAVTNPTDVKLSLVPGVEVLPPEEEEEEEAQQEVRALGENEAEDDLLFVEDVTAQPEEEQVEDQEEEEEEECVEEEEEYEEIFEEVEEEMDADEVMMMGNQEVEESAAGTEENKDVAVPVDQENDEEEAKALTMTHQSVSYQPSNEQSVDVQQPAVPAEEEGDDDEEDDDEEEIVDFGAPAPADGEPCAAEAADGAEVLQTNSSNDGTPGAPEAKVPIDFFVPAPNDAQPGASGEYNVTPEHERDDQNGSRGSSC